MSGRKFETDVAVIGAGPTGLFAVFECGMLKASCHVIDVLDMPGGQLSALYPEKPIYDIPGFPEIRADELVKRLVDQAAPFKPVYHFGQRVETLSETKDGGWRLTTSDETEITARAVIIAGASERLVLTARRLKGLRISRGKAFTTWWRGATTLPVRTW